MFRPFAASRCARLLLVVTIVACGLSVCAAAERMALVVSLGVADVESTPWSGELTCPEGVSVSGASVLGKYPNAKREGLRVPAPHRVTWEGGSKCEVMVDYFKKRPVTDPEGNPIRYPLKPYTLVVELVAETWAPITVSLGERGTFEIDPRNVSLGQPVTFLDGNARVERALPGLALASCEGPGGSILYNDFPAVCADGTGATWTAYIAYQGRANPRVSLEKDPRDFAPLRQKPCNDQLFVAREQDGVADAPLPITGGGLDLFRPAIASRAGSGPLLVWSQHDGQNWDLYASSLRNGAWATPVRLTTESGPDLYPALVGMADGYWLTWQSFRAGAFRIVLAKVDEDSLRLEAPVEVTDGTANCWMPAIAADSKGTVAVGYDTYANGDYDVHVALFPRGSQSPKRFPITGSPRFEDRASLAFDAQDRLWIAWEETGENWGKDVGGTAAVTNVPGELIDSGRSLRVACLADGILRSPKASLDPLLPLQQSVLVVYGKPVRTRESIFTDASRYAYYPRLAQGLDGRLYLAFRQHDYQPDEAMAYQTVWSDFVTVLAGDQWLPPSRVLGSSGYRHCTPGICALPNGGVAIASAGDRRALQPRQPSERAHTVCVARYMSPVPARAAVLGEPVAVALPPVPDSVTAERAAVQRVREHRATVGGATYRILRGDFHRHTSFSPDSGVGDGSIDDAFRYALDAAALDTMGNGDHDNGSGFEYPWYLTQKFYDLYLLNDHFVPMFSYERSVTANGPQGHRNIIMPERGVRVLPVHGRDNIDEKGSIEDTRLLFEFLRHYGFVSIPHTIGTGAGANFADYAPDVDCVVEIYQGARNAYEYPDCPRGIKQGNTPGFYWNLLKAGKKYGIISSSDHRSTHVSYAMLYVSDMSRQGVMEALRKRHCYGATDNILLDVRIGDHIMGDELALDGVPELTIHVAGTGPIKSLDIIRNAEVYHTIEPGTQSADVTWQDPAPLAGESSYYVRVIQENGELAWGTPIWVRRP
jgi:hypothetical protein